MPRERSLASVAGASRLARAPSVVAVAALGAMLLSGAASPAPARTYTIRVDARDFSFALSRRSVPAGSTVRFVVRNRGATAHDFVIGHVRRTRVLAPGKSQVITATFRKKGSITLPVLDLRARTSRHEGHVRRLDEAFARQPSSAGRQRRSRLPDACRDLRSTGARHRAARGHPSTLRRRADRNGAGRPRRRGPPHAVPRPARESQGHERARAPLDRLRARLRDERALLRLLQLDGRQR